jgi:hypothetical protein
VLSIVPSSPIRFTVTCLNTYTAGQTVTIAGVAGSGIPSPNGQWTIESASPTQFTFRNNNYISGSFAYSSGGTANVSSGSATTNITGIPAVLWNQTVAILADGGVQPPQTVSGTGTLSLPGTFNTVTLGFGYQGNLVPMRPEGGADVGTAQGKLKQGTNLVLRLVDSGGGIVGQLSNQNAVTQLYQDPLGLTVQTLQDTEAIVYNYTTTALDSPPPLQSGDFPISFPMRANSDQDARDLYLLVQQNSPLPMTVVGIYPSFKVEDPQRGWSASAPTTCICCGLRACNPCRRASSRMCRPIVRVSIRQA